MTANKIKREQIRTLEGALDRVKTIPHEYMCQSICDAYEPGTSYAMRDWGRIDASVLAPITERIKAAIDHQYTVKAYLEHLDPNLEGERLNHQAVQFRIDFLTNLIAEYSKELA